MSYLVFTSSAYYELKPRINEFLAKRDIEFEELESHVIYDNLIPSESDIKILGTLICSELKLTDILIIHIPDYIVNELIFKLRFEHEFCGTVNENYDKVFCILYYNLKLKYKTISNLKRTIKLPLLKVNSEYYVKHGWNITEQNEINDLATESLNPIFNYFNSIQIDLKKQLDKLKKNKLINKS
jgi:hypothetical protein